MPETALGGRDGAAWLPATRPGGRHRAASGREERVARPLGRGARLAGPGADRRRVYASRGGGLAYPLLSYVKLLLLQPWCGLSDEGLEAADDGRLSFRRF